MKSVQMIALIFTIIGALNWGLVGLFDYNLVSSLFGTNTITANLIYDLVGFAGLINLRLLFELFEKSDIKSTTGK